MPTRSLSVQRSFDDLGTPLVDVTFCVIDFETTGGSPTDDLITEVGAVKLRGGECLGTLQTLVNPGRAMPPTICVLTGITDMMLVKAPRIEAVLGSLVDFIGDAVIVGHNVRFDMGFLQAALERDGRTRLSNSTVDTVALARRLVSDEVPNCKLGTLAERFRLAHRPSHRALDDALATGDLLHVLLERATALGVNGLDDLQQLPTLTGHAQASKLGLTDRLPRAPGVYLFRNAAGRVLYVGKASNLRTRVRSYFSSDERKKVGQLLKETERIDHKRCANAFEARVLEIRLIHHLRPRFNREANHWESQRFVKLTTGASPKLSVTKVVRDDGATYLGPIGSGSQARLVVEAIDAVCPIQHPGAAAVAVEGLRHRHHLLIDPLVEQMGALAAAERFEDAAAMRDRLTALTDALRRTQRFERLRAADRLVVRSADGIAMELRRGILTRMWVPPAPGDPARLAGMSITSRAVEAVPPDPGSPADGPVALEHADELNWVGAWLEQHARELRIELVEGTWATPVHPIPSFSRPGSDEPRPAAGRSRRRSRG